MNGKKSGGPEILILKQFAEYLQIKKSTIFRLATGGIKIPTAKIRNRQYDDNLYGCFWE